MNLIAVVWDNESHIFMKVERDKQNIYFLNNFINFISSAFLEILSSQKHSQQVSTQYNFRGDYALFFKHI